ncbi:MAG: ABC transporter permease [Telmatospirillum sp.]|nr:ABC transporter permease [Telmatospirillum sp.]
MRRVAALVRKESRQIRRDPSSITIGVLLPVLLILLFGYGLSLDVKDVPVAVVLEDTSPAALELAAGFRLSPYFKSVEGVSMADAHEAMLQRKVDAVIRIREDFSRKLTNGGATVEVLLHGIDANRARIIQGYAEGAIQMFNARYTDHERSAAGRRGAPPPGGGGRRGGCGAARYTDHDRAAAGRLAAPPPVDARLRKWFNEADDSHYFLVPGLIVLVMTLIGAILTALVMAREWEQGTLEALFVSPVRVPEILLGKTIPYFGLGLIGLVLCILSSSILFHVPFRGSVLVLCGASMLYLLVSLGLGLLISSAVKNQFLASQFAVLLTFLPALMLSGFLFDLRSIPAVVRAITHVVPARYYVELLQTIFLAGDVWPVILPDIAILTGIMLLLLALARKATRKRVG